MGFDVYGKAPTSAEGTYLRRNAWKWPHLVQLLVDLCPEEARGYEGWFYNEGMVPELSMPGISQSGLKSSAVKE
jgi:hypothetical protein